MPLACPLPAAAPELSSTLSSGRPSSAPSGEWYAPSIVICSAPSRWAAAAGRHTAAASGHQAGQSAGQAGQRRQAPGEQGLAGCCRRWAEGEHATASHLRVPAPRRLPTRWRLRRPACTPLPPPAAARCRAPAAARPARVGVVGEGSGRLWQQRPADGTKGSGQPLALSTHPSTLSDPPGCTGLPPWCTGCQGGRRPAWLGSPTSECRASAGVAGRAQGAACASRRRPPRSTQQHSAYCRRGCDPASHPLNHPPARSPTRPPTWSTTPSGGASCGEPRLTKRSMPVRSKSSRYSLCSSSGAEAECRGDEANRWVSRRGRRPEAGSCSPAVLVLAPCPPGGRPPAQPAARGVAQQRDRGAVGGALGSLHRSRHTLKIPIHWRRGGLGGDRAAGGQQAKSRRAVHLQPAASPASCSQPHPRPHPWAAASECPSSRRHRAGLRRCVPCSRRGVATVQLAASCKDPPSRPLVPSLPPLLCSPVDARHWGHLHMQPPRRQQLPQPRVIFGVVAQARQEHHAAGRRARWPAAADCSDCQGAAPMLPRRCRAPAYSRAGVGKLMIEIRQRSA